MTLKQYLIFMSCATLLSWLAFGLVIFFIDPQTVGVVGLLIFYLTLFSAILGTIAILGFLIRSRVSREETVISRKISASFRQGFFLSFLFTTSLYLQNNGLLVWWNLLLLISALTILEFLFISIRRSR